MITQKSYIEDIMSMLLSEAPLWITPNGYLRLFCTAFHIPSASDKREQPSPHSESSVITYDELVKKNCADLNSVMTSQQSVDPVSLTCDYASQDIPERSIAFYDIIGPVTYGSRWMFSSLRMEEQLKEAEANPNIIAHFVHVDSPGGEAYYLDRLGETMKSLKKPIVGIYNMACSAAYHIASHCRLLYANTSFDYVGCIGTMCSFYDFSEYYKNLGIRLVDVKADGSDLKNKMFDDLKNGKPRSYIERVLNPLNSHFLSIVKGNRPKLSGLEDDDPVLRGETYYTEEAIGNGLSDGMKTTEEAIAECYRLGKEYADTVSLQGEIYSKL